VERCGFLAITGTRLNTPLSLVEKNEGKRKHQLLSLTSLRFFATILVLSRHCGECFGINKPIDPLAVGLWQGLTCFFVLSGFILTYVHPVLKTQKEVVGFLQARFARIWPSYACSLLFYIAIMPTALMVPGALWYLVANFSLTQSWTLYRPCFTAFNTPTWSLSVEAVFYLCFPFLVRSLKTTWFWKLFASILIALLMVALAAVEHFPYFPAYGTSAPLFININPLSRFFEFICGMVFALIFMQIKDRAISVNRATLYQVAALSLVVFSILLPCAWSLPPRLCYLEALRSWILYCGIAPAYASLILTLALEKGLLNRLLSKSTFVYLGECSFSLFLFHYPVILLFLNHKALWERYPIWIVATAWWAVCLVIAIANFQLIEKPCRKFLLRKFASS
jgi:peptidoglycan/LPS O-acetylase OafA/YrhL